MSNRTYIEVVNETPRGSTTSQEIVKVFDDYQATTIPVWEGKAPEDDKDLLFYVLDHLDAESRDLLDFVEEMQKGLYINDQFYDFEEWYPWMKEHEERPKFHIPEQINLL